MKILLIGDSHGYYTLPLLTDLLVEEDHEVDYLYNNGWASYSYTQKPNELKAKLEKDPDLVIVSLGGNNHYLNQDIYGTEVSAFLDVLDYPKRNIVWMGPKFSTQESTQKRHLWTHDFLTNYLPSDISYLNMMQYEFPIGSDGVHYPKSSYEMMIEDVYPKLKKAMKKSTWPFIVMGLGGLAIWYGLQKR